MLFYVKRICEYLDIKTKIIDSSEGLTVKKKNEGLQDIVKHFKGNTYINAIGGQSLYNKENFASQNVARKNNMEIIFNSTYEGMEVFIFGTGNHK